MVDNVLKMRPGNRLRELRKVAGLTQEELARLIGASQAAVSQIENGSRSLDLVWMRVLARALRCKPVDLLEARDNPDILNEAEAAILEKYRRASAHQRRIIDRLTGAAAGDQCRTLIEVEGAGTITILNTHGAAIQHASWRPRSSE